MEQKEPNILLTRVDNRMVHGQVGVTWTKTLGANLIIVADDLAAVDILQQKLMESVALASGAKIRFFTLEHTASVIYLASEEQRIYIVVNNIHSAKVLVEKGVPIHELNLGNLHFAKGKHMVNKKVYVSDEDVEDIRYLLEQQVKIYIQDVPGDNMMKIHSAEDLGL